MQNKVQAKKNLFSLRQTFALVAGTNICACCRHNLFLLQAQTFVNVAGIIYLTGFFSKVCLPGLSAQNTPLWPPSSSFTAICQRVQAYVFQHRISAMS